MNYSKPIILGLEEIIPIDPRSSKFTFEHRIGFSQIQSSTDFGFMAVWFEEWHEMRLRRRWIKKLLPYFHGVLDGIKFWAEKEKALKYEPTPEEKRAGINIISEKVKDFGTLDAIAVRMHISHDDALKLPYSTVYAMLLKDLETSKFERRLHKVYQSKIK